MCDEFHPPKNWEGGNHGQSERRRRKPSRRSRRIQGLRIIRWIPAIAASPFEGITCGNKNRLQLHSTRRSSSCLFFVVVVVCKSKQFVEDIFIRETRLVIYQVEVTFVKDDNGYIERSEESLCATRSIFDWLSIKTRPPHYTAPLVGVTLGSCFLFYY